jgi:transposase-like protein
VYYSSKWRQAQQYAKHIPCPLENLKKNIAKASKILLLDGKYVSVLGQSICVHIAYDTHVGVIDFWLDDGENKTAYSYVLRRLKDSCYEPVCVVSDGHWGLESLLKEERIPSQLCVFHLLQNLQRMLLVGDGFSKEIPPAYKVIYSRIKGIFLTSKIEDLPERINNFRKLQRFWKTRLHLKVLKWFWKKLPNAVMGLSFEEVVPRTNNLLENLNGQIEARLKTFRGVKSEESLNKILKILFHLRKFK